MKRIRESNSFLLLPIKELLIPKWYFKKPFNQLGHFISYESKLAEAIEKYGPGLITVYNKNGKVLIVDGVIRIKVLREMEREKAFCHNLGNISDLEAISASLSLNNGWTDIQILKLSKILAGSVTRENINNFSKTLRYSLTDVKRLLLLAQYDWNKINSLSDKKTFMQL